MKVDYDHWKGREIADIQMAILKTEQDMQLVSILNPEFNQDGNMYCFTYPSREGLPNNCVQGFGITAAAAAHDFTNNFYHRKADGV